MLVVAAALLGLGLFTASPADAARHHRHHHHGYYHHYHHYYGYYGYYGPYYGWPLLPLPLPLLGYHGYYGDAWPYYGHRHWRRNCWWSTREVYRHHRWEWRNVRVCY